MCEALACGCTLVSTNVSGAGQMIEDGRNGFVVASRDPKTFAERMEAALALPAATQASLEKSRNYLTDTLRGDLLSLWRDCGDIELHNSPQLESQQ